MWWTIYEGGDAAVLEVSVLADENFPGTGRVARGATGTMVPCDVGGAAMRPVKRFYAASYDLAMQAVNDHYGYGPYVPMGGGE